MNSTVRILALSAFAFVCLNANAKVVNEKAAQNVAKNFLASKGLTEELVPVISIADQSAMRAPAIDVEAPAYHVFTGTDRKSVIVIAGDDIARPVLGYSFNLEKEFEGELPPAMKDWLNDMERQILQAREQGLAPEPNINTQWDLPSSSNLQKKLATAQWGQNSPFNWSCPYTSDYYQCITGCVPTSYAILMKYYGYPAKGRGITPAYFSGTNSIYVGTRDLNHDYDWDSMPLEISYSTTNDQKNKIAQLMADLGAAIQADYGTEETTALYNKSAIFAHFGYHVGLVSLKADYTQDEWNALMRSELDEGHPILYNAAHPDQSGAHSFILDGYAEDGYYSVNWGWAGYCNGLYLLDALVTSDGSYDYNGTQAAYLEFQYADGMPAVAIVNDSIECPSLEAAVGMAPFNGQPTSIKMASNTVTGDIRLKRNQNISLDLNGFTVNLKTTGFVNYGDFLVEDSKGNGKITMTLGNTGLFTNYGNITIESGEFTNVSQKNDPSETDYRRCFWTDAGSTTHIKNGKFVSPGQVVCVLGKLTIDNGQFECTGPDDAVLNASASDTTVINGGTFTNSLSDGGWSCALYTIAGTVTLIKGGTFTSNSLTICLHGETTIDGGQFRCNGSLVIGNYSKTGQLTINNGTFRNYSRESTSRSLWAETGTTTVINNGTFSCSGLTVAIAGDGIINGGSIENSGSNGWGCLSYGNVTVNYCKMTANTLFYVSEGSTLKCYGGLYSKMVANNFLGKGCYCDDNTDRFTKVSYPYVVYNPLAVETILEEPAVTPQVHYDLNGIIINDSDPGLHIIRNADGKTIKVLYR